MGLRVRSNRRGAGMQSPHRVRILHPTSSENLLTADCLQPHQFCPVRTSPANSRSRDFRRSEPRRAGNGGQPAPSRPRCTIWCSSTRPTSSPIPRPALGLRCRGSSKVDCSGIGIPSGCSGLRCAGLRFSDPGASGPPARRPLVTPESSGQAQVTCPGLLGPSVVRISTWHQGEGHAKEEDLTRADHFSAAAD